ncbi:MAG TPA: hypothetical protein VM389_13950 [Phycisphaerae bacterium]|nr:hypothetical protein [Phycisphaerae bacterium]
MTETLTAPTVPEIISLTRRMCRQHGIPLALEDLCVDRMEQGLARYGPSNFFEHVSHEWLWEILCELIDSFNTGGPLRAARGETPIGVPRTAEALLSVWAAYQAAPSGTGGSPVGAVAPPDSTPPMGEPPMPREATP